MCSRIYSYDVVVVFLQFHHQWTIPTMGGQSNNTIIKKKKSFFLWAIMNAKEMLGFLFWFFLC
jgi:hypothetical protein